MAHVFIQLAVSQAGRQAQLTLHTYVALELLFSTQKTKTSTVVGRSVGRSSLATWAALRTHTRRRGCLPRCCCCWDPDRSSSSTATKSIKSRSVKTSNFPQFTCRQRPPNAPGLVTASPRITFRRHSRPRNASQRAISLYTDQNPALRQNTNTQVSKFTHARTHVQRIERPPFAALWCACCAAGRTKSRRLRRCRCRRV